jgi:hypothetical protein
MNHFGWRVGAFVLPKTTINMSHLWFSPVSDEFDEENRHLFSAPESRRTILGRSAGGLAATMLTLLSVPSSGIAAPAPSKVRTVVSTTKIDM